MKSSELIPIAYQMWATGRAIQFVIDQRAAKILHKRLVLIPRLFRSTCLRWSYLRLMAYSIYIFHQFSVCVWSQFWRVFFLTIVSPERNWKKEWSKKNFRRFGTVCVLVFRIKVNRFVMIHCKFTMNSHVLHTHTRDVCPLSMSWLPIDSKFKKREISLIRKYTLKMW